MASDHEGKLHIVMFPWLSFGHMFPYLELAKLIAQKGHQVSFVSTPRNIQRLPKLPPNVAPLINFVSLPLRKVNNLPENAEATSDIPYNAVRPLKGAHDALQEPITRFLESCKADWIFYDFAAFWAASVASKLGIKCAFFTIFTPPLMAFMGPVDALKCDFDRNKREDYMVAPRWVPPPATVAIRNFEFLNLLDMLHGCHGGFDAYRTAVAIENCDLVVIRGCTDFEPLWLQVLRNIYQKPVLPVGQLPSTGSDENDAWRLAKDWLDRRQPGTVVYVAFGSFAQDAVTEIAFGLEKAQLPFLWVLRDLRLPEGFEKRSRRRGMMCTTWVPQAKILGHVAVGGFLTHSGWTSVVEAVQNEKPLVLLPFLADQGINARALEEKKIGYPVPRDERDGSFTSDSVAHSIKLVMVEEKGRIYREKIKEMKDLFVNTERQERYIDDLLDHLSASLFLV